MQSAKISRRSVVLAGCTTPLAIFATNIANVLSGLKRSGSKIANHRDRVIAKPILKKLASRNQKSFQEGLNTHKIINNTNLPPLIQKKANALSYLCEQIHLLATTQRAEEIYGFQELIGYKVLFSRYLKNYDPDSPNQDLHKYKTEDIIYTRERCIGQFSFLNGFVFNSLYFDDIFNNQEPTQKIFMEKEGSGTLFAETFFIQDNDTLYTLKECYKSTPQCEYCIINLKDFGGKTGGRFCGYPIAGRPIIATGRSNNEDQEKLYALQEAIHMRNFINYQSPNDEKVVFGTQQIPYIQINEYLSDIGSFAFLGSQCCIQRLIERCFERKCHQKHYIPNYSFSDQQLCLDLLEYIQQNPNLKWSMQVFDSGLHTETINQKDIEELLSGSPHIETTLIQKCDGSHSSSHTMTTTPVQNRKQLQDKAINAIAKLFLQDTTNLQLFFYQKFTKTLELLKDKQRSIADQQIIIKNLSNPR